MADIYKASSLVWIWLGKCDDEAGMGLEYFSSMMQDHLSSCPDTDPLLAKWRLSNSMELKAMYIFLNRRWFTRVWTLQEAAMAKSAAVLYGNHSIPWNLLQLFNEKCQTHATGRWTLTERAISTAGNERTGEFGRYYTAQLLAVSKLKRIAELGNRSTTSDVDLLRQTRSCRATEVKDKVLSLKRFLSSDIQAGLQRLNHGLHISSEDLYREIAQILLESNCMNMLGESGLCQRSKKHARNPSWVPDWTVADWTHNLYMLSDRAKQETKHPLYRAASDATPELNLVWARRLLGVKGKMLDDILRVTDHQSFSITTDHGSKSSLRTYAHSLMMTVRLMKERSKAIHSSLQLANTTSCRQHYGEHFTAACYQTLFRGILNQGQGSTVGGVDARVQDHDLLSIFNRFLDTSDALARPGLEDDISEISSIIDRFNDKTLTEADTARYLTLSQATACTAEALPGSPTAKVIEHVQDSFKGRSFFITRGGWMGLGPHTDLAQIKPGDRICVLYGSCTPFIVRPTKIEAGEEIYQLVGEAYVHGLSWTAKLSSWMLALKKLYLHKVWFYGC